MKRLFSNGLMYCTALVLTGHACIAIPSKFQSASNPISMDNIPDRYQAWPSNKVTDQAILQIIDETIKEALDMEAYLKQYIAKLAPSDYTKGKQQPNSAQTTAQHNTYKMVQYTNETPTPETKEREKILNIKPKSNREAIQPITFVTPDLQQWATNVHKYIPRVADFNLEEIMTRAENIINAIIDIRKKDNDCQLTDAQKEKLRALKTKLRQDTSPCVMAVVFYAKTNKEINECIHRSGRIETAYANECFKEANRIYKQLLKTVKEINDLIDLMKIKPGSCTTKQQLSPRLGRYQRQ